jgi:hypothetical protein
MYITPFAMIPIGNIEIRLRLWGKRIAGPSANILLLILLYNIKLALKKV